MGQTYYWKGQTGPSSGVTMANANTLQPSLTISEKYFVNSTNNWNNAANWAIDIGQTGDYNDEWDQAGDTGGNPNQNHFITPPSWPKAGDKVIFDKIENAFLDGATGTTGERWPHSECLFGGTTNDNKWFVGNSTAGKLEKLTIEDGYAEVLYARDLSDGVFGTNRGTGARLGINMVNGYCSTYGASGPNEGLGLYVAQFIDNSIKEPAPIHDSWWHMFDWTRERTFTSNFRTDNLYINGAAHYSFYQDELKRGATFDNVTINRNADWSQWPASSEAGRGWFKMKGDTVNYDIATIFKDTSERIAQTLITSRTSLPSLIVGSKYRYKFFNEAPLTVACHVDTAKIYPTENSGITAQYFWPPPYSKTFCPSKGGWHFTDSAECPPEPVDPVDIDSGAWGTVKGMAAVVFTADRDGISGSSGPGQSSYHGVSVGHLYMQDTNPFYNLSMVTGDKKKNYNTVMIDLTHPSNGGATISNLYGYSGYLYPEANGITASISFRILNGEINAKTIVQGHDPQNEPWIGFGIAGHTLGIGGIHNGLLQLENNCDIRLVRGARVGTTTAQADQTSILTDASINWSPGK